MRARTVSLVPIILVLTFGMAAASAAGEVSYWKAEQGLSEPKVIDKVNPEYPKDAREEGVQGTVVLDVVVASDGSVGDVNVVEDPDTRLSHAATAAVVQWRFEPARDSSGKAVSVRYYLTVKFRLE
jgi:protein TonB